MTWGPPDGKPGVYRTKEEAIVGIGCAIAASLILISIAVAVGVFIVRIML